MAAPHTPFDITGPIGRRLDAVLTYWQDLRRGEAEIPFWDDLSMPAVRRLCGDVFLLDVFAQPERFRFGAVEVGLTTDDEARVAGRFIDELDLPAPFQLLRAQASATVEAARPTVYAHQAAPREPGYQRLLLPAWGEGAVRMLLGAVERG
jgi:hypothetical protein